MAVQVGIGFVLPEGAAGLRRAGRAEATHEAKRIEMTVTGSDKDVFPLAQTLAEIEEVFLDLKAEMRGLQDRLRADEPGAVRDGSRLITDIRGWLRIAYEMEARFHDRKRKQARDGGYGAVDFDRARDQIRCRLDRLRRCCHAGGISGRAE
ncbi:MAG: hypothetical protein R3256_00690 [Thalassovita sp.]|nr:hypothetical protein [Thalassovita sp.]